MAILVLRGNFPPAVEASATLTHSVGRSYEGVVLFSGISFGLMILAAIFQYLELPPPVF
jgi:hypothetical protein